MNMLPLEGNENGCGPQDNKSMSVAITHNQQKHALSEEGPSGLYRVV